MIKVNIESNEKSALDFVKEIQSHPLLKDIDVKINNANDYALFL